jgi:hypothetical protein
MHAMRTTAARIFSAMICAAALLLATTGCGEAQSEGPAVAPTAVADTGPSESAPSPIPPADDAAIEQPAADGTEPGTYPIAVDLETAAEPALIKQVKDDANFTFIVVDNVQLGEWSSEDGGDMYTNENPRLRTFVLPHTARFALHHIPEGTADEIKNGLPHAVDYDRFIAELATREPSDWVYVVTVNEGVVASVVEEYFP